MNKIQLRLYQIGIILLLIAFLVNHCNMKHRKEKAIKQFDQTILALSQDTLEKKIELNRLRNKPPDTTFVTVVTEMSPTDIMKTEVYKTLDEKTKGYIKELKHTKNLLVSMRADVIASEQYLQTSPYPTSNPDSVDVVTINKGTKFTFQDTTGGFQYNETITFEDSLKREFTVSLKFTPKIKITRIHKTGAVEGSWEFEGLNEFDNLHLTNGYSFYTGVDEKTKRKLKTLKVLKITGGVVGGAVLTYASYKTGQAIERSRLSK